MSTHDGTTTDEDQIRDLIKKRIAAVHAKYPTALTSHTAKDAVLFDAMGPLQQIGVGAESAQAHEWFAGYEGPIGLEVRDLEVAATGDVAWCRYLNRVSGTMTSGHPVGMWLRTTLGLRKVDGRWTVAHEHTSVPFDARGAASMDLTP